MALNKTFLTYIYNNNTMTGTLKVNNSEFETGKDYYTMTMKCSNSRGTDTFVYHITSSTGNLPAIILGGSANASTPWGCPFFGSWGGMSAYVDSIISLPNTMVTTLYSETHGIDTTPFYSYRLGNIGGGGIGGGDAILIEIDADFPIFMGTPYVSGTDPNYVQYMCTQDANLSTYCTEIMVNNDLTHVTSAINYYDLSMQITGFTTYYAKNTVKKNGVVVYSKHYLYQIRNGAKIYMSYTNPHPSDGSTYNADLVINLMPFSYKQGTALTWSTSTLIDTTLGKWTSNTEWTDYDTGDQYSSVLLTNIPMFSDQHRIDGYLNGLIDESQADNGGELNNRNNTTGDDLESTDIPNISIKASGTGCNVWDLSSTDLNNIMNILYDNTQTTIDAIEDGLWMYGNNPIDFFISLYYVPFNVSNFYDEATDRLYLGFYDSNLDLTAVSENKSSGQRIVLFDTVIAGTYGDWRDYTNFKYELYLPFIGFIDLQPTLYVGHTLKCELAFDVMTHNIRYYLFIDDKISERIDGSVGYDIPLISTDQVNKAKSDIEALKSMGSSAISGASSLSSGNVGGLVNSISGMVNAGMKMSEYPHINISGSISSSMNVYDIMYAYLKITEKESIMPGNLHSLYGYPSYFIGPTSYLSGYCELADIRFTNFTGTETEQNALKSELMGGVIL